MQNSCCLARGEASRLIIVGLRVNRRERMHVVFRARHRVSDDDTELIRHPETFAHPVHVHSHVYTVLEHPVYRVADNLRGTTIAIHHYVK